MDERDAKHQGVTIVYKSMRFNREYVSCSNCAANYDQNNEARFCQTFSTPMVPEVTEENMDRAARCGHWVAKGMNRNMVITPEHKCWYED